MLSGAGFFLSAPLQVGGLGEGREEEPTRLAAIQIVGGFSAHLHPPACSVVAADWKPPSWGERRAYFGRRLGGDPVDYLLIKDGWVVPTLVEQTPSC